MNFDGFDTCLPGVWWVFGLDALKHFQKTPQSEGQGIDLFFVSRTKFKRINGLKNDFKKMHPKDHYWQKDKCSRKCGP